MVGEVRRRGGMVDVGSPPSAKKISRDACSRHARGGLQAIGRPMSTTPVGGIVSLGLGLLYKAKDRSQRGTQDDKPFRFQLEGNRKSNRILAVITFDTKSGSKT